MKKAITMMFITVLLVANSFSAHADTSMVSVAEWPLMYPTLFLKGGVNAVTSGDALVFWAVGDTVSVIGKDSFTELSTLRISTGSAIQDMLFDEATDTLYIAAGYDSREDSGGLQMADMSDPSDPVITVIFDQSIGNPGSYLEDEYTAVDNPNIDARGLGLYNGILYLADDNFGLRVIDVGTDPANPTEVPLATQTDERFSGYKQPNINGSFNATGGYINLRVYPFDGKIYAFVLDFYQGIKVFDVTDPAVIGDPVVKDTRSYIWFGSVSLLSDLFVTQTNGSLTAYVTGANGGGSESVISRMNADIDETHTLTALTNFGRYLSEEDEARSVCVSGDYAYLACGTAGLKIVTISGEPAEDTVLTYDLSAAYTHGADYSYTVHADGTFLYLATGESGLVRLDMTDPTAPASPVSLDTPVNSDAVQVQGDVTFMLDRAVGLRIFDTTEPGYPTRLSVVELSESSTDFCVSGNYAYILADSGTLTVVDVSDPSHPLVTASALTLADSGKLFVSETTLYVAGGSGGIHRVNTTDPLNLTNLPSITTAGEAFSVCVAGNRAYVAEGATGLEIFDLSDPANPGLLVSAPMSDARDVTVLDQATSVYALVADGASGLKILDVTDLSGTLPEPVAVSTYGTDTPAAFTAVSISAMDDRGFVGIGADGILVFDLSNPEAPVELIHKDSADYAGEIAAYHVDDTLYLTVAERGAGMQIAYIYDSLSDEAPAELAPSIDAGCFIGNSGYKQSEAGWGLGPICRAIGLFICNIMTGDAL